jgi:homocitrate synthase NifV
LALRIASPGDAEAYPEISRFICRKNGFAASPAVTQELQMNDVKEIGLGRNREAASVRIVGLDDIFSHDYGAVFSNMRKHFGSRAEFCPENGYSCATAAAVEWVISGGTDLAASFGGIGGKAALEEVLLSLRIVRRYKPSASFDFFPQIAALLEDIVGAYFSDRKAVIGRKIFHVESGIHVDGILKKPQMYEPYLPELVGCSRRFVIGKHSGRKSIAAKLRELGHPAEGFDIARILSAVRDKSVSKLSSLTDEEFTEIALKYRLK